MAISETLRLELAPLGVTVACILVGTVGTNIHTNEEPLVLPSTSLYQSIYDTINKWARGEAGPARGSVEEFADKLMPDVLGTKSGKFWRGPNAGAVWFAATWLPTYVVVSPSPFAVRIVSKGANAKIQDKLLSQNQGLEELMQHVLEKKHS